ncbi:hypothetical protein [Antarctobacter jejuensis]|uniref:hypothetical protein n=1 Tax=Antarctobacter jejuensis TaxID=1439938 RepID=UPI003FD2D649
MDFSLQINSVFRVAGWKIVKPLATLDFASLPEDIAQYSKGGLVVKFGYHGTEAQGDYRIYAIRNEDWERPVAALSLRNRDMALDLLRQMPGLLGRLGPL